MFKAIRPASGAGRPNPPVFELGKFNLGGLVWLPAPAGPGDAAGVPFSYVSHSKASVFKAIVASRGFLNPLVCHVNFFNKSNLGGPVGLHFFDF